jgi:hypothetical protein
MSPRNRTTGRVPSTLIVASLLLLSGSLCLPSIARAAGEPEDPEAGDAYVGLKMYVGDIHVHTGLAIYQVLTPEDPHTIGTAEEVLDAARSRGLDFVVLTDHTNNMNDPRGVAWREESGNLLTMPDGTRTSSEWEHVQAMVAAKNDPGRFVAFLGLEYTRGTTKTSSPGHKLGIFPGDSLPRYCSNFAHNVGDCPTGDDFLKFVEEQGGLAATAHPCADWGPSDWSEHSEVVNSMEILAGKCEFARNGYNDIMLRMGYKLGARGSSDSHHFEVGANDKTICFAPELSRAAILDAMRKNLCYYADNFPVELKLSINGHPMGSEITDEGEGISIQATAHTEWETEFDSMELIRDGKVIQKTACEDEEYDDCALRQYYLSDTAGYYYVGLSSHSGRRIAITSPIWVRSSQ